MANHIHNYKFLQFLGPEYKQDKLDANSADNYYLFKTLVKCSCGRSIKRESTREEVQDEINKLTCQHCGLFGEVHGSTVDCLPSALKRISNLEKRLNTVLDAHQRLVDHLRSH